jgi:type IV pilus assembly protein PilW
MQPHTTLSLESMKLAARQAGRLPRIASRGLSLVELLISIALGLIILTALIALYGNVSRTNSEMAKTNQLIENGRFAVQLLREDVAHAGFWGPIESPAPTAVPDPCLAFASWPTDATQLKTYKNDLLGIPVQGYADASALGAACGVTGVVAKSDVLVVRHANTCVAGAGCEGGADTGPHIQISGCRSEAPPEPEYLLDDKAALDARPVKIRKKPAIPGAACAIEADRRKMVVNIYYVALSGGVPTLMRVTFANGAYSAPQPLIDGIEGFRVEYGVDNLGSNGLPISATNPGDGNADTYASCPAAGCNLATLANVVTVKLHVLARNLEPTAGYVDNKSYTLGPLAVAAANDSYKRHVFTTAVRLVNPSSRRETP